MGLFDGGMSSEEDTYEEDYGYEEQDIDEHDEGGPRGEFIASDVIVAAWSGALDGKMHCRR